MAKLRMCFYTVSCKRNNSDDGFTHKSTCPMQKPNERMWNALKRDRRHMLRKVDERTASIFTQINTQIDKDVFLIVECTNSCDGR